MSAQLASEIPRSQLSTVLPIYSVLDQGAALRASRAVTPAGGKPPRPPPAPGRRATDCRRTAAPEERHDHGQAARKPNRSTSSTVGASDCRASPTPGLACPRSFSRSRRHLTADPSVDRYTHGPRQAGPRPPTPATAAPEEPSAGKIDLPTICPQPVVDRWTQPDSAGRTTTAPDQHLCWSGAASAPGGG